VEVDFVRFNCVFCKEVSFFFAVGVLGQYVTIAKDAGWNFAAKNVFVCQKYWEFAFFVFFLGLFGTAYLSAVAAFEVLVGGAVDNSRIERKKVVFFICGTVYVLAIPPMINFKIFLPWDLIFGSGMQALGSLLAVITAAWCIKRSESLKELTEGRTKPFPLFLYWWIRIVIPAAILFVGINWLLEFVFNIKIF